MIDYQARYNRAVAENKRYLWDGFVRTDGGRAAEGFGNQRNDCTVRAIVCACEVKYKEAFHLLMAMGRRTHKRFPFEPLGDTFFERIPWTRGAYRRFRETHMTGTFIVKVKGHVFTLVDGQTMDIAAVKARKVVLYAWRVTEEHKLKLHDFFTTCQDEIERLPERLLEQSRRS